MAAYFDELDRMPTQVLSAFRKSLSSSPFGWLRAFSTPTFPSHGVDGMYNQSDKKRWLWKCRSCGHWQHLTRANIMQRSGPTSLIQRLEAHDKTAQVLDGMFDVGCVKCFRTLNRLTAQAKWVAESPKVTEYSGYAMSQLDCAWISADLLMRELRDLGPGLGPWMNYDLGEAYLGDAGSVVEGWVYTLINPDLMCVDRKEPYVASGVSGLRTVVGIDWGKRSWAVVLGISDGWKVPAVLALEHFDDTAHPDDTIAWALDVVKRWEADCLVADAGYGQDRNPELYKALSSKFWACLYPSTTGTSRKPVTAEPSFGPTPPPITDANPVVTVDRTSSLKTLIADLRARRLQVAPLLDVDLEEMDRHCRSVAIVVEPPDEKKQDGVVKEVAKTLGADHYLHALNYARIAMQAATTRQVHVGSVNVPSAVVVDSDVGMDLGGMPTAADVSWLYDYLGDGGFEGW